MSDWLERANDDIRLAESIKEESPFLGRCFAKRSIQMLLYHAYEIEKGSPVPEFSNRNLCNILKIDPRYIAFDLNFEGLLGNALKLREELRCLTKK